jgi:conjugative relaxase-like TrwC/TraI family protein
MITARPRLPGEVARVTMLSLHAGYDISYLTDAVGQGGAEYYLSGAGPGGEPPGFWAGSGAQALGLAGEVDARVMRALYHHDVTPDGTRLETPGRRPGYERQRETLDERIEATVAAKVAELGAWPTEREVREIRLMARADQRNSVPFFDMTLSMPKSVSVTHASFLAAAAAARAAGDQAEAERLLAKAEEIDEAVREGARSVVRAAERQAAYIRTGHHGGGQGQWRDAKGLTAAIFVQHTSRDGDPQLHAHIAILNRAQRADGEDQRWRTLDSRSLHRERLGIAAYAGLVAEQRLQAAGFALVKREDGNGAEIGGVTQATMLAFSSRRTAITPAIQRLVDEYTATHGRAPSRRALWSLRQWATLQTRKTKHEVQRTAAEDLAAWAEQSRAAEAQVLADVHQAVGQFASEHEQPGQLDTGARHLAIRIAVAEAQRQNATWTAAQLAWELRRSLHVLAPAQDPEMVLSSLLAEALAGQVPGADVVSLAPAPDPSDYSILGVRESDGVSVFRPPGEARYATADMLDTEEYLLTAARRPVRQAVTDAEAGQAVSQTGLNPEQREVAAGLLTTQTAVTVLSGPAGSGKTHVVAEFAYAWTAHTGRRVVGLTTATNAARQLTLEGLAETYNTAQFLGKLPDTTETRGNIPVHRDDVLVIDEASQVSTADLAAIQAVADRAGARIILTGDVGQLGSVEAGGIMRLIAHDQGHWLLREVRRFDETWEAKASLRLHDGEIRVWEAYKTHGRIRSGPRNKAYADAVRFWTADFSRGKETLLLAGSNAEAAELARQARQLLIEWQMIRGASEITLADGNDAGIGDLVRARLNTKIDAGGQELTNRDTLRIEGWRATGADRVAIAVRQIGRDSWSQRFEIPAAYLEENAELAYAGNVHVAQGRTVDTGHLLVSPTLTRESLYVGMTRGRERNTAHVETGPAEQPGREMQQAPPEAVLAAAMQREDAQLSATETIREAQAWPTNSQRLFEIFDELSRQISYPAFEAALQARLGEAEYRRYQSDPQREVLLAELRGVEAAGYDVDEVLDKVTRQSFEGARSIAAVLHGRVNKLDLPRGRTTTWEERAPKAVREHIAREREAEANREDPEGPRPPSDARILAMGEAVSDLSLRRLELGTATADRPPAWAVRYLGMPPREPGRLRDEWISRVGLAASYREAAGHADPEQAVGPLPVGKPALREAYMASVVALEMREEERARDLPQRDLEARIRAYGRAVAWAPQPVNADLEATEQAEQDALEQAEEAARRRDMAKIARGARELAAQLAERRAALREIAAARTEWEAQHVGPQAEAREAMAELDRRGVRHEDPEAPAAPMAEPEPAPKQPAAEQPAAPETDLDRHLAQAREAAARLAAEREQARQAEAEQTDLEHSTSRSRPEAEGPQVQPWQPGQAAPQREPERAPEASRDEPEAEAELELEM